jgi:hypothetical protein
MQRRREKRIKVQRKEAWEWEGKWTRGMNKVWERAGSRNGNVSDFYSVLVRIKHFPGHSLF